MGKFLRQFANRYFTIENDKVRLYFIYNTLTRIFYMRSRKLEDI